MMRNILSLCLVAMTLVVTVPTSRAQTASQASLS